MLIDSHAHLDRLDLQKYDGQLEKAMCVAKQNNVGGVLSACVMLEEFETIFDIAHQYENVWCSVGVHPSEQKYREPTINEILEKCVKDKVVGIGETGLDYSYKETDFERQRKHFRIHIQAAKKAHKPLIIHSRQAQEDTLRIMQEEGAADVGGVMHCYTENWEMAKQALDWGFYISISGIITFKNAHQLREVAKQIPLDRLLIETDAPFLSPEPHRGKPNEPAYVRYVAEYLVNLRKESYTKISNATTENFCRLFKISKL